MSAEPIQVWGAPDGTITLNNVHTALARVMEELPSIGKDGQASQQQGGYRYRGIEAIVRHAAPLLAKHGVVFVPQVTALEIREITVNGKPWTDTILTVDYRICGPGGPGDYITATVVGMGRDNSDKGANKALTQAFKYALIQTLCIADDKDDADSGSPEADAPPVGEPLGTKEAHDDLKARVDAAPEPVRVAFLAWRDDQGFQWHPGYEARAINAMNLELDRLLAQHGARSEGSEGDRPSDSAALADAPSDPDEPRGYAAWTNDELIAEIKKRNTEHPDREQMPHSGNKERLVAELRAWDAVHGCPWDFERDAPQW